MAIELHLTIRGETMLETIQELRGLSEIGSLATLVSGVAPHAPNAEKGNGADTVSADTADTVDTGKKPRGRKAAAAPEPAKVDREAVLEGLTKIYGRGDPKVRTAITEFRDKHGANRLRDLKDDVIPDAAALLAELKLAEAETAP
jgi:hypothetical protein